MPRRNPLDPYAWETEEHPFDMPGEKADIRLGVHAAEDFETALSYAVHKASQEGPVLSDGSFNCGIVFTLDMSGLEPLPEADAVVIRKHESVVINELKMRREIVLPVFDNDLSALASAIFDFVDEIEVHDGDGQTSLWFEEHWQEHEWEQTPWVIGPVLARLAEDDPHRLMEIVRNAFNSNIGFPSEVWAEAIGQWRYMSPVGSDRLLSIRAVRPVEPEMLSLEDEEDGLGEDPDAPQIMSLDWLEPDTETLWERRLPKNADILYHGTDIKRARLAFPELADVIVCPWPYGQPEGVGPA